MTAGLRFVETLADPAQRGALTGAMYAAAYAGMTAPLVASTIARFIGFDAVLGVLVAFGVVVTGWLWVATRPFRAAAPRRTAPEAPMG